jgi:hypothetical protein
MLLMLALESGICTPVAQITMAAILRRKVYGTTRPSQGNAGHRFGDKLSEDERMAVTEYLRALSYAAPMWFSLVRISLGEPRSCGRESHPGDADFAHRFGTRRPA